MANSNDVSRLSTLLDRERLLAGEGGHFHLSTERCLCVRDWKSAQQVLPVSFKKRMAANLKIHKQISAWPSFAASFTLTRHRHLHSVVHSGRNVDFLALRFADTSFATTTPARLRNALALTTARGTGCLHSKEALRLDDLPLPTTGSAFHNLRSWSCT
tara:strand:+ start:38 stop:511 length:474 start_codon:yes stop_codon:yes gene_type:complete